MLKHLTNIPVSDLAHQSTLIKERNAYIKANKFSVAEGGFANFFRCILHWGKSCKCRQMA